MRNLEDVWRKRSAHYMEELQKYMRYIFTGHMAIVIVFLMGAGGYQYSHWLDANHGNINTPSLEIATLIVAFFLMLSRPVTLLKKPDEVYLLPLETKLGVYFKHALRFTFTTQAVTAVIVYIVLWPMLRQVTELEVTQIVSGLIVTIVLKWLNIQAEFAYRWNKAGERIWLNRLMRYALNGAALWGILTGLYLVLAVAVVLLIALWLVDKKHIAKQPFPYEHFVALEDNRMMGIYRFANYFTDVPQVHGSIKRRPYFDFLYNMVPKKHKTTFEYYLFRSVIRTDDHFYLWLRLVVINALIVAFVDITIAGAIISAALAFAVAIQLKQAIASTHEFTMSMLYPLPQESRQKAAVKIVRYFIVAQAVIVLLASIMQPYFYVYALIVLIIGEMTLRFSK